MISRAVFPGTIPSAPSARHAQAREKQCHPGTPPGHRYVAVQVAEPLHLARQITSSSRRRPTYCFSSSASNGFPGSEPGARWLDAQRFEHSRGVLAIGLEESAESEGELPTGSSVWGLHIRSPWAGRALTNSPLSRLDDGRGASCRAPDAIPLSSPVTALSAAARWEGRRPARRRHRERHLAGLDVRKQEADSAEAHALHRQAARNRLSAPLYGTAVILMRDWWFAQRR
jgi:hypothetical protein